MLFTWDTNNLCIVFRSWHIHNTLTLILSLLAIVALGAGYEALRDFSRRYDARIALRQQQQQHRSDDFPSKSALSVFPFSRIISKSLRGQGAHVVNKACEAMVIYIILVAMLP
jgi:hypothetical protein